jgi:tRNA-dependent cyclodipeptide synthase
MPKPKKSRLVLAQADKEESYSKQHILNSASQILLPISVGQPYHEGNKLEEILRLIKKAYAQDSLPNIKIVLAVTLQRYNLAMEMGKEPKDCEGLAREKGDKWEARYLLAIKKMLGETIQLETWDVWTKHELFQLFLKQIEDYYTESPLFREAIESDIREFERRRYPSCFSEAEKAYCRAYIKEECAVLKIWEYDQVSPHYRLILYPKKLPQAMTLIKSQSTQFKSFSAELHISLTENSSTLFSFSEDAQNKEVFSNPPNKKII